MFNLYDLVAWTIALLLLYGWWYGMGQKDRVIKFTRRYCQQLGYQLLDQTMVFRGYRFFRDDRKRQQLCRYYGFDISTTGDDRYQGEVWVKHGAVIRVMLHTDHTDITQYPE